MAEEAPNPTGTAPVTPPAAVAPAVAAPPAPDLTGLEKAINAAAEKARQEAVAELEAKHAEAAAAAERAQMSEVERREAEAADREVKAEQRESAATERERLVLIKAELADAGIPKEARSEVARMVDVEGDLTEDNVAAAVEKLKAKLPQLFTPAAPTGISGTVSGKPPASRATPPSGIEKGRERARAEKEAQGVGGNLLDRFHVVGRTSA